MIKMPVNIKIYVSSAPCDMRKQFGGLEILVRDGMQRDPRNGDMYVFYNRRKDLMKVLFHDGQGFCLLCKRMDEGTFKLAPSADGVFRITSMEFSQLMRGFQISKSPA